METKKKIYIFCLLIYLAIVFGTEILYRKKLYELSVEYEEKIKQEGFFHYFYFFWSYIFIYGMLFIGTVIVMLFYPITVLFCHLSMILSLIFTMCFLKSIYSNSRPYWDIYHNNFNGTDISDPTECDGGFGNPSGHSLMSTSFLCLWYLFINSKYVRNFRRTSRLFIQFISLLITIACILLVTFSRIYRQIHSFNQILFGTLLGISVFFTFCFIIEYNKIEPANLVNTLDKCKYIIIPILLILFAISVILGFTINNKNEEDYLKVLEKYCNYREEQIFGKNTAYHSGVIFIVIGGYLGILFLKYKINQNYLNNEDMFYHWNKGTKLKTLEIAAFSFILPAIPLISILFVPYRIFELKFILEVILYCWYGFAAFGLCFYYACILFTKENIKKIHEQSHTSAEIVNKQ